MKCPLLVMGRMYSNDPSDISYTDCLKEECAWWYKDNQSCAMLTIAQGAVYAHKALLSLDSKIPLGGGHGG